MIGSHPTTTRTSIAGELVLFPARVLLMIALGALLVGGLAVELARDVLE